MNEDLDDERTGNPDGTTEPEVPAAPEPPDGPWRPSRLNWQIGWQAGYEAALLDRGATS